MLRMRLMSCILAVTLTAGAVHAAVLSIGPGDPGYDSLVREAWLRGYGGGTNRDQHNTRQPDAGALGTAAFYRMYSTDAPGSRQGGASYLLKFDVSSIPTHHIVNSATLELTYRRNQGNDVTGRKLAKLLPHSVWQEGPNVNETNPTNGAVTWNNRVTHPTTPTPWNTAAPLAFGDGDGGGTNPLDHEAGSVQLFNTTGGATNSLQTKTFDVTAWAQAWVSNPAANNGVVTWGGTNGGFDAFWSILGRANNLDSGFRPRLVIDHVVPEPATVILIGLGGLMLKRRRPSCS